MATITDELRKYITPETIQKLSTQVDAKEENTAQAVNALIPMMLGGLSKNVEQDGAASLNRALENDHDGTVLEQLGSLFSSGAGMGSVNTQSKALNSAGILGHLFGAQQSSVQNGVSQATGLNAGQVSNLMSLLAPVVMGAVGRAKRQNNLNQDQVADLVKREREDIEQQVPEAKGGKLNSLLDSNNDGKVNMSDDIAKVGMALGAAFMFGKKNR